MEGLADFFVFIFLLLIVMAVIWFILPFAIFGTKPRIDYGNKLADETNKLLSKIAGDLATQTELLRRIEALALAGEQGPVELVEEAPPD